MIARSTQPRARAGISSSIAELIAAYSPPIPKPVKKRKSQKRYALQEKAGGDGRDEVQAERGEEQLLAAEAIGQVAEEQRPDGGAGDVERAADGDLVLADAERFLLGRRLAIAPTIVTSSPSRIQTVPRPSDDEPVPAVQGSRSMRAGMRVSTVSGCSLTLG